MKCSLLTLSTFIDGELTMERRSEVDAHLVGCPRCTSGAATLREEKARLGRLARVHVDDDSARLMLEQVGITLEEQPRRPHAVPAPPPVQQPAATRAPVASPVSPWIATPSIPAAIEEMSVPTVAPDVQPDLPFDGALPVHPSHQPAPPVMAPSALAEAAAPANPPAAPEASPGAPAFADDWLDSAGPADSWEADLPPPIEARVDAGRGWDVPYGGLNEAPAAMPPLPQPPPLAAAVPTRVPVAAGPAGILGKLRDAVAVRVALARGSGLDESVQIVSGTPARRGARLPSSPGMPSPDVVAAAAAATERLDADTALAGSIELNGTRGVGLPSHAARSGRPPVAPAPPEVPEQPPARPVVEPTRLPADPEGWHAFAASSYPADAPTDPAPRTAPQQLGRHTRAITRERRPLGTWLGAALAVLAAGIASAGSAARRRAGRLSAGGPDSRVLAGVAGVGLIFVVALLIGHTSTPPRAATAARTAPPAATQPRAVPSAAAPVAPTAVPTTVPTDVQTFGSGATGFELSRLRYGQAAAYMRVVFDLGAVGAVPAGTPRVVVENTAPNTVLVTLNGTAPATAVATPRAGTIISSVTLVSGNAQRSVYRFVLTRPATATAFFLLSPTRFVLDLH